MFWGRLFDKRELSTDFVDLSIGRIHYFVINSKMINSAMVLASINSNNLNNALFLHAMELQCVDLPKKQLLSLSIADFTKLRNATKSILKRYGIIEDKPELIENLQFAKQDIEWFDKQNPFKNGKQ